MKRLTRSIYCQCAKVKQKRFKKGEVITTYLVKREQVCILITGTADLIRYDLKGNKSIVERYHEDDMFGELFYNVSTNNELSVEAKDDCVVIFFDAENLYQPCPLNCDFHKQLNQDIMQRVISKYVQLNNRIECLTKRTIRDKLLYYFQLISGPTSKTVSIPFSYTDLADYLNVERSALMRELKNLSDEGFIERNGSKITLKY